MRGHSAAAIFAALLMAGTAAAAYAQLAVSANDAKVKLVEGKAEVQKSPQPDTVAIIDMRPSQPKVLAEVEVPNSVVGPPLNVAVSPKEEFALITSSQRIDPADPSKMVPDDKLTVIDLSPLKASLLSRIKSAVVGAKGTPLPKVLATLQAGQGAAGVSINKAGTLALVANRSEGTVSVFTISGSTLTAAGKIKVGDEKSNPSAIVFAPDGKTALVTREGDHRIVLLSIDGSKVEATKREIVAGLRPNAIDMAAKGEVAVVANIGITGSGDANTISIIDMKVDPPRVVNTYSVGQTPEAVKMSPDGKFVAIVLMNGSSLPPGSPFYNDNGLLQVWARNGTQLTKTAELPIGHWCQGVAWSSNSKTLLVQCMVEEEISVIRFSGLSGRSLQKVGSIKTKGGPAGIRTAEP